jgi:membrane associated rhomboid family serine protease
MIPIRDTLRARRTPLVNYAVIALCAAAFAREIAAGADVEAFVHEHALVPRTFVSMVARHGVFDLALYAPFVTSMFLHASLVHFAGNMLFLWVFGDNVEDRMGHAGYALFYLLGGVAAGAAHVFANPGSVVPTVGASGAIAAVMGAYLWLYPRAHVHTLVIFFFMVRVVAVPALVWLGMWFLFQLVAGAAESAAGEGGVAWWAHIGGFAFGLVWALGLGRRAPVPV